MGTKFIYNNKSIKKEKLNKIWFLFYFLNIMLYKNKRKKKREMHPEKIKV